VPVEINGATLLVGATEVTQEQFLAVMGYEPSTMTAGGTLPVESVSWQEAALFSNRLSAQDGLPECYDTGSCSRQPVEGNNRRQRGRFTCAEVVPPASRTCEGYRLPDREEFIAFSPFLLMDAPRRQRAAQVHAGRISAAGVGPYPAASLEPNSLGIYDTLGNVAEWLNDAVPTDRNADARCVAGVCYETAWRNVSPENHSHFDAADLRSCVGFRVVQHQVQVAPAQNRSPTYAPTQPSSTSASAGSS
jgi:formylglycine-generating enzyme required for sulfatase activity